MYEFDDVLEHYGMPRRSGRYPYGSGENPYQHGADLLKAISDLQEKGFSEKEIADSLGMPIKDLRARKTFALAEKRNGDVNRALNLLDKGYSKTEIGRIMGIRDTSVNSLLDPTIALRQEKIFNTANVLRDSVDKNSYIDIGASTENLLGVSKTKLDAAVIKLVDEGYVVLNPHIKQLGMKDKYTNYKILAKPGTTLSEVVQNLDKISLPVEYHSKDQGKTFDTFKKPENLDSSRIMIRYSEDGGKDRDGVIELRRGVEDISLGNSSYAQVRIAVDGTHYLKGMALYSDNMPDGYDVVFNTNKSKDVAKMDVLKKLKSDPNNPFGATIKLGAAGQREYIGEDGEKHLSVINKVNDEGDWSTWSRSLSSQFLSKQYPALAKQQLNIAYDKKKSEYEDILALTNPEVKKKLLEEFSDSCDSASIHLKAAALPRQASKVILPVPELKENEIYAPGYKDGENVILVRYPHGGTFEIPSLVVNNRNKSAKSTLGTNPIDAVGIHPSTAARLSGADFDGDTVLVIPTANQKLKVSSQLKDLENFDPAEKYSLPDGAPVIKSQTKQTEMGKVSNLITDMTLQGASDSELAAAVKHSMVVIDSEKHHYDYKQSFADNGIASLKKKYQGSEKSGAATLISRASSEVYVPERKEGLQIIDSKTGKSKTLYIDPDTGEKLYRETGREYYKYKNPDTGKLVPAYKQSDGSYVYKNGSEYSKISDESGIKVYQAQSKVTRMESSNDAYSLSSGTVMENLYADYANKLKALGNSARKEMLSTESTKYDPEMAKKYSSEVASLNASLNIALKNAPLERKAQSLANSIVNNAKKDNPDMDKDDLKKLTNRALAQSRAQVGANKKDVLVNISEKEWEAILSGAVSSSKITQILNNTDTDQVKKLATPKTSFELSSAKVGLIQNLAKRGYTMEEIADDVGVSVSTISKYV